MLPVPELECRCGRGIKWGDAKPLVQFGLVDRHAVQFHQVFLERKGEKANVRIVVQKDGGRVVLLYCSGHIVNVIDDVWFWGGFAAVVRQHVLKVLGPKGHAKHNERSAAATAVRSMFADHWPCQMTASGPGLLKYRLLLLSSGPSPEPKERLAPEMRETPPSKRLWQAPAIVGQQKNASTAAAGRAADCPKRDGRQKTDGHSPRAKAGLLPAVLR
jgi:hypothetical protein